MSNKEYTISTKKVAPKPRSRRRSEICYGKSSVSQPADLSNIYGIIGLKLDKSVFDDFFEKVNIGTEETPAWAIRAKYGLYSDSFISAKGVGTVSGGDGSGGTGGSSYGRYDDWSKVPDATDVLAAQLGVDLNTRLIDLTAAVGKIKGLESGVVTPSTYTKVTVDTYGRVIAGTSLTAADIPALNWSKITTGKPTTLAGYGITDGLQFTDMPNYVAARFVHASLAQKAQDKYIELWQNTGDGGRWFNLKAGKFITEGGTASQFVMGDGSLKLSSDLDSRYLRHEQLNGGLIPMSIDSGWGNSIGKVVAIWTDKAGSSAVKFKKDNPSEGKMSMLIDGTVYINEGVDAVAAHSWVNTKLTDGSVTKLGKSTVGATNLPIYLNGGTPTAVNSVGEAFLSWGGKSFAGGCSPLDAALCSTLGANRFAGAYPSGIKVEYTTDGTTWLDYGATDAQKRALTIDGVGTILTIGKATTASPAGTKAGLRVTFDATQCGIYTVLNKIVINVSTNGSSGCRVRVERAKYGTPSTWTEVGSYGLSGWSGHNVINMPGFTFGGNNDEYSKFVRLTFSHTGHSGNYSGLNILNIYGYGGVGWNIPTILAKTGHLYAIDSALNASFPAAVTATTFSGALSGNAASATRLQTPRAINGTSFDGTVAITTAKWGTARNVYIRDHSLEHTSAAVSVDGSAPAYLRLPSAIDLDTLTSTTAWINNLRSSGSHGRITLYAGYYEVDNEILRIDGEKPDGTWACNILKADINGNVAFGPAAADPDCKVLVDGAMKVNDELHITRIKCGDGILTWNSTYGMWELTGGIFSSGAITAKQ